MSKSIYVSHKGEKYTVVALLSQTLYFLVLVLLIVAT